MLYQLTFLDSDIAVNASVPFLLPASRSTYHDKTADAMGYGSKLSRRRLPLYGNNTLSLCSVLFFLVREIYGRLPATQVERGWEQARRWEGRLRLRDSVTEKNKEKQTKTTAQIQKYDTLSKGKESGNHPGEWERETLDLTWDWKGIGAFSSASCGGADS